MTSEIQIHPSQLKPNNDQPYGMQGPYSWAPDWQFASPLNGGAQSQFSKNLQSKYRYLGINPYQILVQYDKIQVNTTGTMR